MPLTARVRAPKGDVTDEMVDLGSAAAVAGTATGAVLTVHGRERGHFLTAEAYSEADRPPSRLMAVPLM
jgi:hypothetical protein